LIQIEATKGTGFRIQHGFSGAPVWDVQKQGVVGMIVAVERDPTAKVAFCIPNYLIQQLCPAIRSINTPIQPGPLEDVTLEVVIGALKIQFSYAVKCSVDRQDRKARIGRMELKNTGDLTIPAGWRTKIGLLQGINRRVTLLDTIVLPTIPPGIIVPIGPYAADVPRDIAKSEDEWHLELYILDPQGNEELLFRSPNISFN
jgi:hypothetical protein